MTNQHVLETIAKYRVIPVVAIESVEAALPLADALLAGGLPVIEVTFRTAAAADVIAVLSRERPNLLVGAGTVLTPENLEAAMVAGAQFGVAPGFNPAVVRRAQERGFPFVPGVCTPTDIEAALAAGCTTLKFFPAEACGGVAMVKTLAAPYAHLGIRFVPTGGVSPSNLQDYLACPEVLAVGGTWLAKKEDIRDGSWPLITDRCKVAMDVAGG